MLCQLVKAALPLISRQYGYLVRIDLCVPNRPPSQVGLTRIRSFASQPFDWFAFSMLFEYENGRLEASKIDSLCLFYLVLIKYIIIPKYPIGGERHDRRRKSPHPERCGSVSPRHRIAEAGKQTTNWRTTLISSTATDRHSCGGLELNLTRVDASGYTFPDDYYRIVSVVRGRGIVSIESAERDICVHDHFGIPQGMSASIKQLGSEPLVVLDALIRGKKPIRYD